MDSRLSQEHEALRTTVADFAQNEVAPVIGDYYMRGEFPYPVIAQMAQMGLFGLPFPEEYGGQGGDYFALCLAIEALGRVAQCTAITLAAGGGLAPLPLPRPPWRVLSRLVCAWRVGSLAR